MMLVEKYGITKEYANSALACIRSEGQWKKIKFTPESLKELEDEIYALGWSKPRVNLNTPIDEFDFCYAATDDASLAAFYLYKVHSSKERGIEFSLSLSDLRKIISKKKCYFSGQTIVSEKNNPNRMTLDRLNNKLGYTKENIVPCAYWVNQLKGELFENPEGRFHTDVKTLMKIVSKISK